MPLRTRRRKVSLCGRGHHGKRLRMAARRLVKINSDLAGRPRIRHSTLPSVLRMTISAQSTSRATHSA